MPRKRKVVKRKMRGGYLPGSLGENNLNALNNIAVGENNLNAIKLLEMPKPPLQVPGQIVNIPAAYPVTGSVPLFDRIRGALKRTKVISRGARALGATRIANFAESHGYGRKRPKRRMRGKGPALVDRYGAFVHAY